MGEMRLAPVARGLLTFVPALNDLIPPSRSVGHTDSARYCYGVWLKHLTLLHAHGMPAVPNTLAELGPGESLGVGLCALLSGANHYVGLDAVAHSSSDRNLQLLPELIRLFRARAPNPDKGWPAFASYLDERSFPGHILGEQLLEQTLAAARVEDIRVALANPSAASSISAEYRAPWTDPRVIKESSVDAIISHSVLEHVVDLEDTYGALYRWLKPGGWMSHQIDLKSHGLTRRWNGFRASSERLWKLAVGRRPYMINRHPASVHLRFLQAAGFNLVTQQKYLREDGVRREELAPRWAGLSDEDLNCSGLYVIATK
jgi:SAM-dependent methyltransferase